MKTEFDEALDSIPKYIMDCPIVMHWVDYKGERKFAMLNYEQSLKSKRAMIDLCYCATEGLNGHVERTVQYHKTKFKLAE